MKRTPTRLNASDFPHGLRSLIESARVYDSSSSPEARVYFLDTGRGYYLKRAAKGALLREAEMTEYFHALGLGARVCEYISCESDFLLCERVVGEDCTHSSILKEPRRLAETMGAVLRELHALRGEGCPVADRRSEYLATVDEGYRTGRFDPSFLRHGVALNAEEAYSRVCDARGLFRGDTLIHGDFCLPNIMLDGWKLSGFIDVGCGGIGDRHIDLFWGVWTLNFNLGTDEYGDSFLAAYGKEKVDRDMLDIISCAEAFG